MTGTLVDGGDQVAQVITLLLLPVTLTDQRISHWHATPDDARDQIIRRLIAISALVAIRVQVAGIYFHAAVGKMAVPEWRDGTAIYYWFTDPMFGLSGITREALWPVITNPVGVTLLTWGTILFEITLFAALFSARRVRPVLLVLGIMFHAAIAVIHGLLSFSLAMCGALILFLRPPNELFNIRVPTIVRKARSMARLNMWPKPAG